MADALVDALVAPVRRLAPVNKGLFGIGANTLPWPPPAGAYDPRRPILPPNPTEAKHPSLTAGPQEYTGAILPYRRDIGGNLHWAVPGMMESAWEAAKLPGDVYAGRVDPLSDEGIGRATDLAGLITLGSGAIPGEGNALRMGANPAPPAKPPGGIRAFHGSPHDFDRFDISKIGTGEGAQVYGHGLYFAENEGVAKSYRDAMSIHNPTFDGKPFATPREYWTTVDDLEKADWRQAKILDEFTKATGTTEDRLRALRNWHHNDPNMTAAIDRMVSRLDTKPSGRMYEASIDASPDEFLDWDKPLNSQPQAVQDAFRAVAKGDLAEANRKRLDFFRSGKSPWRTEAEATAGFKPAESFQQLAAQMGAERASEALRAAGIKGIRYKDAGSRGAGGSGTHNYVVFDDAIIDILRKYGIAGLIGGGAAAGAMATTPGTAEAATPPGDPR